MSRIAKKPITFGEEVEIKLENTTIHIKGPKGTLTQKIPSVITTNQEGNTITLCIRNPKDPYHKAIVGTIHRLITNKITGVTQGFTKRLTINGVGYRANIKNNNLILEIGFSHPVELPIPKDIMIQLEGNNCLIISGIDKQQVGQVAANIRATRKPEPYKGKGIMYEGEIIRRKAGKQATGSK